MLSNNQINNLPIGLFKKPSGKSSSSPITVDDVPEVDGAALATPHITPMRDNPYGIMGSTSRASEKNDLLDGENTDRLHAAPSAPANLDTSPTRTSFNDMKSVRYNLVCN